MKINYYDFLRKFPELIELRELSQSNIYINYLEDVKKLAKIDMNKFSHMVFELKQNNQFTKEDILNIHIDDNLVFMIKNSEDLTHFEANNINEIKGKFNIFSLEKNFSYPDEYEMKNIKRSVLIDSCLDEKDN